MNGGALQPAFLALLLAFFALAARRGVLAAGALALQQAACNRRDGWPGYSLSLNGCLSTHRMLPIPLETKGA